MTIDGKEIGITKQPFSILKKNVCDDSKDLEDMIKRVKEYQHQLDDVMLTKENEPILNSEYQKKNNNENTKNEETEEKIQVKINPSRSLFTKETVERIEQINSLNNDYERGA